MPAELAVGPEELPPPERGGEEIARHVDEILSRSEFQGPPRSIVDRVLDYVSELISEAIGGVIGGGRGSLAGFILFVVLLGALVFVWIRFVPTMSRDPGARADGATAVAGRRAVDWTAEADAAAAAGRWRDALRCRYRALIARLSERGVIEEVAGRTAGEYRHELHRALPVAAPDFSRATELFELAWYGDQSTDTGDHDRFVELSDRVLTRTPS